MEIFKPARDFKAIENSDGLDELRSQRTEWNVRDSGQREPAHPRSPQEISKLVEEACKGATCAESRMFFFGLAWACILLYRRSYRSAFESRMFSSWGASLRCVR